LGGSWFQDRIDKKKKFVSPHVVCGSVYQSPQLSGSLIQENCCSGCPGQKQGAISKITRGKGLEVWLKQESAYLASAMFSVYKCL
jgi:hypothetical protein